MRAPGGGRRSPDFGHTLKRAKKLLKIKRHFLAEADGKGGRWVWELPPAA